MKILAFILMLAALAPSMEDIFNECLEQSDVAKILARDQDACKT